MSKEKFSFDLLNVDGNSRVGQINTHRGIIDTPTFMTVGTLGTIKSAFIDDVILSGLVTSPFDPSPLLIVSTNSIPLTTLPKTVYCRSKKEEALKQIKN